MSHSDELYAGGVPKLWSQTIEAHRRGVRDAILHTTATLVAAHGLHAVTMSRIAEDAGIGRATLYKYFPDIEAILVAWHERQVATHLDELAAIGRRAAGTAERLEAVLAAYARIVATRQAGHGPELSSLLHRGEHVARARQHLRDFLRNLLAEAAAGGVVRADVSPDELASYCLHALEAAPELPSEAAVQRLVEVTLAGLRPPSARRSVAD